MEHQIISFKEEKNKMRSICLGFFDGLHIGHQQVFKACFEYCKVNNSISSVMTFYDSPKPNKEILISYNERLNLLEKYGFDEAIVFPFNDDIKGTSPHDFISFLIDILCIKAIFCGNNYRFGRNGEGNVDYLIKNYGHIVDIKIVDDIIIDNTLVSTSIIKEKLLEGKIEEVNRFLGRDYYLTGIVQEGLHNGVKLGFPTMNINLDLKCCLPLNGVYYVNVKIGNIIYKGIANIGYHPSISKLEKPILEIHLLEYNDINYGQYIVCYFKKFMRKEIKFKNIEHLKSQINKDKEKIKDFY